MPMWLHGTACMPCDANGMNLIIIKPAELQGTRAIIGGSRARHIREVLGSEAGHEIRVGLLNGPVGRGTIRTLTDACVEIECVLDGPVPRVPQVSLILALPRPRVMKKLWSELSSLGVGHIILTNANRVERMYFDTHILQPEHYEEWIIDGLQQARDTRTPPVKICRKLTWVLQDLLPEYFSSHLRLFADPGAPATVRSQILSAPDAEPHVVLAVGPEGGWNDHEREAFAAHGFQFIGLGERTLRTDIACISLLALAHAALEERRARGMG